MKVRFFAGAAEAWGGEETHIAADGRTASQVIEALSGNKERLTKVLAACSLLADGKRVSDLNQPLDGVSQLDVLPPFAGG